MQAWAMANDTLHTSLPLRFPPFVVALGCIYSAVACSTNRALHKQAAKWFASLCVDEAHLCAVSEALRELYASFDARETSLSALLARVADIVPTTT